MRTSQQPRTLPGALVRPAQARRSAPPGRARVAGPDTKSPVQPKRGPKSGDMNLLHPRTTSGQHTRTGESHTPHRQWTSSTSTGIWPSFLAHIRNWLAGLAGLRKRLGWWI